MSETEGAVATGNEGESQGTPAETSGDALVNARQQNGADTPAPDAPELPKGWQNALAKSLPEDKREKFQNIVGNQSPDKFAEWVLDTRAGFDQRIPPPPQDDPEKFAEFAQKHLGAPKDPAEYQLNFSEDAPQLSEFEQNGAEEFKQVAHRLGLTQRQMDGLVEWNDNFRTTATQAQADAAKQLRETTESELKRKWGPDYEPRLTNAAVPLNHYLGERAGDLANLQLADGGVLGAHPLFVEMMADIGGDLSPDLRHVEMERSGTIDDLKEKEEAIKQEAIKQGKSPASPDVRKQILELREKFGVRSKPMSPLSGLHGR
jgi:hypothetical protein